MTTGSSCCLSAGGSPRCEPICTPAHRDLGGHRTSPPCPSGERRSRPVAYRGRYGCVVGVGSFASLYALEFVDFRTRLVAKACKPAFVSASLGVATWLGYRVRPPSWPRALAVGIGGALYRWRDRIRGRGRGKRQASLAIGTAVTLEAIATTVELDAYVEGRISHQLAGVNMYKMPFVALAWWSLGGEVQAASADLLWPASF